MSRHWVNAMKPLMSWKRKKDFKPWAEVLSDGSKVEIRASTPLDAKAERAFIETLSPELQRFRFLGQLRHPTIELIRQFDIDYQHETSLAAFVQLDGEEKLIGISRYNSTTDGSSCECEVTVLEPWHHKGLGTVLMKHLIEVARSRGILYMFAVGAIGNKDMADLARFLGFTSRIDPGDPTQAIFSLWV